MSHIDLSQFTGSENAYRIFLGSKAVMTEGVKYLAEQAGAFWLVQDIIFYQIENPQWRNQSLQAWKLSVNKENDSAVLTCTDGDYNVLFKTDIEFTDFPLPEVTLWFIDGTLLLPSEY